ncbi:MAG TPA: competence protein CoiA family protein [Pyrinomonadaceae bacterium]|nr:competence protein CoiA family protein [Pyrinomonadaceae bacterium]
MQVALKNGVRVRPTRTGERALCQTCEGEVLSKCGEINVWHWAHRSIAACDSWIEADTEWHSEWKARVPESWIEIVIEKDGKRRLADIRLPNGLIVKLQRSSLSPEQIRDYERFFGNMIWIFDVQDSLEPSDGGPRLEFRKKEMSSTALQLRGWKETPSNYRTFRWKHAKKHIAYASRPVYLDVGKNYVFNLQKLYPDRPAAGFGFFFRIKDMIGWFHQQV